DDNPGERDGDRLYVAGDNEVGVFELSNKQQIATIPGTYEAIAVDEEGHWLLLATADGQISRIDTAALDELRIHPDLVPDLTPEPLTELLGATAPITELAVVFEEIVAIAEDGTVFSADRSDGTGLAQVTYPVPLDPIEVDVHSSVIVDPAEVGDPAITASAIAAVTAGNADVLRSAIERATEPVPITGLLSKLEVENLQEKIDGGELPGVTIEDGDGLAIGLETGIVILDPRTLNELAFYGTFAPVTGMDLVAQGRDEPTIYAANGTELARLLMPRDDAARLGSAVPMPNTVTDVQWNPATTMVHILGRTQDDSASTVYVVEPRSDSVFADAALTSEPVALLMDADKQRPAEDRDDILTLDGAGNMQVVETGNNQFAYRFPGVVLGSLMAVCIYLLARFLFARRSVAIIASLLVLADGMFFANARIAMNDTYVAFFIVAAFTLFVPLWLGRWRNPIVIALAFVAVGVLLGLAFSSKWVGAYAIGGMGLLILLRSALGRIVTLVAMVGLTALLGYIAITPNSTVVNPQLNYPFLGLMLALTALLAVGMTLRPVRFTRDELRLAVIGPLLAGGAVAAYGAYRLVAGPPPAISASLTPQRMVIYGVAVAAIGIIALGLAWLLGRYGYGPLVDAATVNPDREPSSPPPSRGWLRPGSGLLGLPWLLALGAITVIPVAVYVAHYIPWIDMGNYWLTVPQGESGQNLIDLQKSMYDYHNFLRATHPASSPWWAWPLDLKPVWFEQNDYANSTTAVIYDTGNLVLFWLAIPAVAWLCWQAWKRRSLSLTFVAIAIASLWLPWARIDRATFQYHIFTTLPFSFLALAYFLAELWHGPSRRTWQLARVAAALAVIGAPLLWLLRLPLCGIARTEQVNEGTEVCASLSRVLVLTDVQMIGVLLAVGGLITAGVLFWRFRAAGGPVGNRALVLPIAFSVALVGLAITVVGAGLQDQAREVFSANVQAEWPALGALLLLLVPAYFVLRATDPRKFTLGVIGAAAVWFVAFYPNFAALPVPTAFSQIHLGLLPTWNWGFQFGVNMDEPNRGSPEMGAVALLAIAVVVLCLTSIYASRAWRARDDEPVVNSPVPEAG
ncbi:MAG TPA: phospholipid carrier-dependent glycosyltransferase, partial [Candidatus Limnocylindrales bacterium]|nr:phospholipid carrier-dependent glycosyltransferase [Candidatus Limnocylindrales bacterium]